MVTYSAYAKIDNGHVVVRSSAADPWGRDGWPPRLAREFGQYIIDLAVQAEKSDPRVIELTEFLAEHDPEGGSYEDMALELIRAGYRK